MWNAAEASHSGANRVWRNPRNESGANRCKDVTDAVISGEGDLINRHDSAPWSRPRDPAAEACGARHTRRNNPAVHDPDATWNGAIAAISNSGDAPNPSEPRRDRVVKIDDEDAVRIYAVGEESLHLAIPLNSPMPIKMVNRDVCVDGNIHAADNRGELEL